MLSCCAIIFEIIQQVRGLVPYVVGRYTIIAVRELGPDDVFPSGMAALTTAVDSGELLMEHVYPAKPEALPLMKQTLTVGLEVKLERTHDISAVIHAERLIDGRILVTAVPLLYGSYTVTRGLGTFRLEPPLSLNLVGGWPLFKSQERASIEQRLAEVPAKNGSSSRGPDLHTWLRAPLRRLPRMNWCASNKPGLLRHLP